MAINLTDRYIKPVQERWFKKSFTQAMAGNEFDFLNDHTIKTHSVDTAPLQDYNKANFMGSTFGSRYGEVYDLTDTENEYTMVGDKTFQYAIDEGDEKNQDTIKSADRSLSRELDHEVFPYLDKYNLRKWAEQSGARYAITNIANATACFEDLIDAQLDMDNKLVPESGRCLAVNSAFYKRLMLNEQFVYTDKMANKMFNYQLGELAGFPIVKVPDRYFPAGVCGMVTQKSALLAPMKLKKYKIHTDPINIDGWVVQGRIMHDAFVISPKRQCVGTFTNASAVANAPKAISGAGVVTGGGGVGTATATGYLWTTDGSDPLTSRTAHVSNSTTFGGTNLQDVIDAINFGGAYDDRELATGNVLKMRVIAYGGSGVYNSEVVGWEDLKLTSAPTNTALAAHLVAAKQIKDFQC